jgi:hypothetical protein
MSRWLRYGLFFPLLVGSVLRVELVAQMQMTTRFEEICQAADIIFVGTVRTSECRLDAEHNMIFTDVYFDSIDVLAAKPSSVQKTASSIKLTYAGGAMNGMRVSVADAPEFQQGNRYVIFGADDGKVYGNPIICGSQGLFLVLRDETSANEYVVSSGRRPVVPDLTDGIALGHDHVERIRGGVCVAASDAEVATPEQGGVMLIPAGKEDGVHGEHINMDASTSTMTVDQFRRHICTIGLLKSVERPVLRRPPGVPENGEGGIHDDSHPTSVQEPPHAEQSLQVSPFDQKVTIESGGSGSSLLGGTLGVSGYQTLPIVMQQVSTLSWTHGFNNNAMWVWNQYMDL